MWQDGSQTFDGSPTLFEEVARFSQKIVSCKTGKPPSPRLQALNPQAFLERGFSVTLKDGRKIVSSAGPKPGDLIEAVLKNSDTQSIIR